MTSLIEATANGKGQQVLNGQRVRHLKNGRVGVVSRGYISPNCPMDSRYVTVGVTWDGGSRLCNNRLDSLAPE